MPSSTYAPIRDLHDTAREVCATLADADRPLTRREIDAETGLSQPLATSALRTLRNAGHVEQRSNVRDPKSPIYAIVSDDVAEDDGEPMEIHPTGGQA